MIKNYNDFITAMFDAGFSGAVGGKDDGVFGLFRYGWGAEEETGIEWHTDDSETDPWQWRMRVLNERNDIAYAKIFFKKAGYITKEWYPYFLAARRNGRTFEDEYLNGTIGNYAKRMYDVVAENGKLPLHDIKRLTGFKHEDNYEFDGALTDLQMKLFLTMCGRQQKISHKGQEYGWASTMFCTAQDFWPPEVIDNAAKINATEAEEAITERVKKLNPLAIEKKIIKFIKG